MLHYCFLYWPNACFNNLFCLYLVVLTLNTRQVVSPAAASHCCQRVLYIHLQPLTWFIQEWGSYQCRCIFWTRNSLLLSSELLKNVPDGPLQILYKVPHFESIASLSLLFLCLSIVSLPLFLSPHTPKQKGLTWNGNSELLTVAGWVLFCLGSPARRGLLQTNKRDPWRAWHFHLALASLHWVAHSFQLTPALYVVSGAGAGAGEGGVLGPDRSARHSAAMRWHTGEQGWGCTLVHTQNRDMRKTNTHPCLHTETCASHAWTHRHLVRDRMQNFPHIFLFLFAGKNKCLQVRGD